MVTALPFVVVDCVNDAWAELASPESGSLAVKPAVCVPRHQLLVPTSEQLSAAELSETTGAVLSIFTGPKVVLALLPAASVQVPLTDAVVPSVVNVWSGVVLTTPEPPVSVQEKLTFTSFFVKVS